MLALPPTALPPDVDAFLRYVAAERSGGWDEANAMCSSDLADALDDAARNARDLLDKHAMKGGDR